MKYILVEREKLGPNAYRVSESCAYPDQQTGFECLVAELRAYPDRYGPDGSHRLVLLSDGGRR